MADSESSVTENCRENLLRARYGELLTPEDLAEVLHYPSGEAVLKARSRGVLPVPLGRFPHRRGWYATPRAVARCLDDFEAQLTETVSMGAGR